MVHMSVYLDGLLLGNSKINAYTQISKFQQTLTWLSQITLFIILGLFVSDDALTDVWFPALLVGLGLMFFALGVLFSYSIMLPFMLKLFHGINLNTDIYAQISLENYLCTCPCVL